MAGLCAREGCAETTGGGLCATHKRYHREKVQRLRAGESQQTVRTYRQREDGGWELDG